jgi:hypothetical protein
MPPGKASRLTYCCEQTGRFAGSRSAPSGEASLPGGESPYRKAGTWTVFTAVGAETEQSLKSGR